MDAREFAIFGGLGVALVGIVAALAAGLIEGSEATAYSTIVLVGVTGYYVYATRLLVNETREARRQEVMPELAIEALESGLKLVNVGSGPALDISLDCSLDSERRLKVQRTHLRAGDEVLLDDRKLNLVPQGDEQIHDEYNCLHVSGTYENVLEDESQPYDECYPLSRLAHEASTATGNEARQAVEQLKATANQLADIEKQLAGSGDGD